MTTETPFSMLSAQVARLTAELGRLQSRMDRLELVPECRSASVRATEGARDLVTIIATIRDPLLLQTAPGRRKAAVVMRAQGWTVGRIARALGVSERTVRRVKGG